MKGIRTPAPNDTTSEPQAGNSLPGAPVIASTSGGFYVNRNQGGTVEYFCIPPLIECQGMGIFYTHPKADIRYKIQDIR